MSYNITLVIFLLVDDLSILVMHFTERKAPNGRFMHPNAAIDIITSSLHIKYPETILSRQAIFLNWEFSAPLIPQNAVLEYGTAMFLQQNHGLNSI
jgi:hypothetical protein